MSHEVSTNVLATSKRNQQPIGKEKHVTSSIPPTACRLIELPIRGMDCTECTQHVQHALCALPGVAEAQVYLSSEKAVVRYDPAQVELSAFRKAVEGAGYTLQLPMRTVELKIVGMDRRLQDRPLGLLVVERADKAEAHPLLGGENHRARQRAAEDLMYGGDFRRQKLAKFDGQLADRKERNLWHVEQHAMAGQLRE